MTRIGGGLDRAFHQCSHPVIVANSTLGRLGGNAMPRLNYGTLLENIVVLEASRACLSLLGEEDGLAFASSFAMPPLTECWASPGDVASSPAFRFSYLQALAAFESAATTVQGLWSLCLNSYPDIPVCPYRPSDSEHEPFEL